MTTATTATCTVCPRVCTGDSRHVRAAAAAAATEASVAQVMGILLAVPADQRTDVRVLAEAITSELRCTYRDVS